MNHSSGFLKIEEFILHINTVSEANSSEHWTKKAKRHALQKQYIRLSSNRIPKELPIHIKLTRIGGRFLDKHDNLPCSLKYIFDEVCAQITGNHVAGRADDDERISVEYSQEKGSKKGVRFEFFKKD
jgi:hypothetical protein